MIRRRNEKKKTLENYSCYHPASACNFPGRALPVSAAATELSSDLLVRKVGRRAYGQRAGDILRGAKGDSGAKKAGGGTDRYRSSGILFWPSKRGRAAGISGDAYGHPGKKIRILSYDL